MDTECDILSDAGKAVIDNQENLIDNQLIQVKNKLKIFEKRLRKGREMHPTPFQVTSPNEGKKGECV